MQKRYDVFISYRRDGGFETANLIAEKLRNQGYNVFIDIESLRAGNFNEQLYQVIEECKDFILVLPKNGLDRCINPEDWLRKEIMHAMSHTKNIIPIMLADFQWPEIMPEGIEKLNQYQAIAAGNYDYFDASIEKLKKYLKSKNNIFWSKYKSFIFKILFLLILIGGYMLYKNYTDKQEFTRLCFEQSNLINIEINAINANLNIAKLAHDKWIQIGEKFLKTPEKRKNDIKQDFILWIQVQKKSILQNNTNSTFIMSDETAKILNRYDIDVASIKAFYSIIVPDGVTQVVDYLSFMEDNIDNIGMKMHISDFYDILKYSAQSTYYYYLALLSTMPEEVYTDFHEMLQYLNNFTEIPLSRNYNENTSKAEAMQKKVEAIIMKIGPIINKQEIKIDEIDDMLIEIENKIKEIQNTQRMQNTDYEEEIITRTQNIKKLSSEIIEERQKLQKIESDTEESMRNIIEKNKLLAEDDQYVMWAKIVNLATNMASTLEARRKMELSEKKDKEAAQAKGYDTSGWVAISYSLSMENVLEEVKTRLDEYASYFPDTKNYVPSIKQFYSDVQKGKRTMQGMIIMGTKDDLPHPVFKIGDIVLSRKGKTVNSLADYKSVSQVNIPDSVTFLRLNNQYLQSYTQVIPNTEVQIGLLAIKN